VPSLPAAATLRVWLPEGCTLDYDMTGRRCAYFYALYPFDWAARNGMAEP
jgi:ethanolamine utilization protein EutQ